MDEIARINAGLPHSSDIREWPRIKTAKTRGRINGAGWFRMDVLPFLGKLLVFAVMLVVCGLMVYACA